MRVLHLTLSFSAGGRRNAIATLISELATLGVECGLGCLEQLGCPEDSDLPTILAPPVVLHRSRLLDWSALRRLSRYCHEHGIEIIHAHDAASQFTAALAKLANPRLTVVTTFHRSLDFETARFRDQLRNAIALLFCRAVITGSRERQQHYIDHNLVSAAKVVRIPFGIDTQRFRFDPDARTAVRAEWGLSGGQLVLGAVGHFGPEKGLDRVLQAYGRLAELLGDATPSLVIVGGGTSEQESSLRELAAKAHGGQVVFAGYRSDMPRCFSAFDLLIHAPRQEAFGLVLAEAISVGIPVVATSVGGIPDLVRSGETGSLVGGDNIEALAHAIAALCRDDAQRQRFARKALSRRCEFNASEYARRHLLLYRNLLSKRPADRTANAGYRRGFA